MSTVTSKRRPGIVFQAAPTPPPETLPRMDIAGFVGFASRGPLNVPVPLEDESRFTDVFGPPLELVRDPDTGEMIESHLAPTVASFFRTGGRRCWVVRTAEAPAQRWFVVPGLVDARSGRPAVARARSLGSGFDDLRVGTVLRRQNVPNTTLWRNADRWSLHWAVRPEGVEPGTLVRITLPDEVARPDVELFVVVDEVSEASVPSSIGLSGEEGVTATAAFVAAYQVNPPLLASPPGGMPATIRQVDSAAALPGSADAAAAPAISSATLTATPRGVLVQFDGVVSPVPEAGRMLIADLDNGQRAWLKVDVARNVDAPSGRSTRVEVGDHRWPVDARTLVADGARMQRGLRAERITFDLIAWRGGNFERRLSGLHPSVQHSRSWLRLPTDGALFDVVEGAAVPPEQGSLAEEVFDPRFPLAGPVDRPDAIDPAPVFVPFAMARQPDPAAARGPVPDARPALLRDGLRTFSNSLFLDEELADATTASLRQRAREKLLLPEDVASRGLYTLWPIREVTLLALPDAVHRGWKEGANPTSAAVLAAPDGLTAQPCANDPVLLCIDWTPVSLSGSPPPQSVRYELQESPSATFEPSTQRYEGTDVHVERAITEVCPRRLFFRVRAVADAAHSPWSKTAVAVVPGTDFRPQREEIEAPVLRLETVSPPADVALRWERIPQDPFGGAPAGSPLASPSVTYELERARDPGFVTAETVSDVHVEGLHTPEYAPDRGSEQTFYRVRAHVAATDQSGPWSNTAAIAPKADPRVAPIPPRRYDEPSPGDPNRGREGLLDLQRAALRFCAARGDVVAILALPGHDRQAEAQDHTARLTRLGAPVNVSSIGPLQILPLRADEVRTLSYGALYHPWATFVPRGSARGQTHPPDGLACGVAAARTLQRGAWIAPANVPMNGVIALRPALGADRTEALLASHVNVLHLEPRGVVALAAQTLALDEALRPIGTRRLLILLRRLAERVGQGLVFESNSPALRRQAAAVFERLLGDLYRRGALAGTSAREAYRVVADASVNPPERVERGQLIVEVRVAPARPLEFLVIRLMQRSRQTFTVDER